MKKLILALLLLAGVSSVNAADGYRINLQLPDAKGEMVYLAHYYGKPLPTIFKADSALVNASGNALFQSKEPITGGIYIITLKSQNYFELLLSNGDDITITGMASQLPNGIKFKNSPENDRYLEYITILDKYGEAQKSFQQGISKARTATDSNKLIMAVNTAGDNVKAYRASFIAKYPGSLQANIFKALQSPQVPKGKHYLPGTKVEDTMYAYNYYKNHYWDKFDLTDDRLVYTPLYERKLEEYFNQIVAPLPDSVQKEGDILLAKTRGHKEMFKYTLWWLTQNVQNSKVMGMDQAFVYFVENYHMKGDAYWMDSDLLAKYIDRARKVAPNVIGNIAPDIKMVDINKKEHSLYDVDAKYTLLVFWAPDCGGCRKEMPLVDTVYQRLKNKGMKVFAVRTEGDEKMWTDYIKENKLEAWTHVYDPEHKSKYRSEYDVYGTPIIYLLDDKKIIRGKKLDHSTIGLMLEILENQEKNKS